MSQVLVRVDGRLRLVYTINDIIENGYNCASPVGNLRDITASLIPRKDEVLVEVSHARRRSAGVVALPYPLTGDDIRRANARAATAYVEPGVRAWNRPSHDPF